MAVKKGFKLPVQTALIKFDKDSEFHGAEVRVKISVTIETLMRVQDLANEGDFMKAYELFGDHVLESWNIEDDDGHILPASGTGMVKLPATFANILMTQWVESVTGVPDPLGETSPNGGTLEELSVVTEVLSDSPGK